MVILLLVLLLALLFVALRLIYDHFWDKGFSCTLAFRDDYATEGEVSALKEVVVNDKFLPLPAVEVDFHMDRRLDFTDGQNSAVSDQTYRRDIFALSVRQKITRTLEFSCLGRGYFQISEAGLTARDLFLTQKYLTSQSQHTEFYVLPKPVPGEKINVPFSHVMGTILSRQKLYDDPFEFAGLREYTRSDPMKYINWKATAHTGKMLTNLHESTLSQRVLILLDMEGRGIQHADFLNEFSVRIACTLAERLLHEGVELGLYSNGHDVLDGGDWKLEAVSGWGSLLAMKKKFACVQSDNDLPSVFDFLPDRTAGQWEENLLVLVSRSQRQETVDAFAEKTGKERGILVIPYQVEHKPLSAPKNVDLIWLEV